MSIAVLGSGAFGTALAISLSRRNAVTLWARSATQVSLMRETRENRDRLPGVTLPDSLRITDNIDGMSTHSALLLAIPMQQLRGFLQAHVDDLTGVPLIACCKGAELKTGVGPVTVIRETVPGIEPSLLTGPSFAHDIARGLPTALTLACADAELGKSLQQTLIADNLRLYRTTDTIGAELGGALKNVIAIACGAVMGAGLGESARAALMTRGYAEMQRMAIARGAQAETLAGLSGFGDLALTCTSAQSRNYQRGLNIGQAKETDPNMTVEGAATARAILDTAASLGIDMPITQAVVALLDQKLTPTQAMNELLARPLKEE